MLGMWSDLNGEYIIIGEEDCKPGDPVLMIPLEAETILEWIRALSTMYDCGEIINVPGSMEKCVQ